MFGIIFTLEDGTELAGAIMHDGNVYLHNPVVDTYNTIEDALADHPGSTHEVVGPVIGLHLALNNLDSHYERTKEQIRKQEKEIETEYHLSRRALLKYSEALEAQGKENEDASVNLTVQLDNETIAQVVLGKGKEEAAA